MMEKILLGVLCLSGWVMFSACLLHHYHFVRQSMNWTDAQTYCREKYIDLATAENHQESIQLIDAVESAGYRYSVWIGLSGQIDWRWSDGYAGSGAEYRSWAENEPVVFYHYDLLCVTGNHTEWQIDSCTATFPFVCNKGTQASPEFVFVDQEMTWFDAQSYCRENYKDLATVTTDGQNLDIENLVPPELVWIGLFGELHSDWSDGSGSSYRHWFTATSPIQSNVMCGYTTPMASGQWGLRLCESMSPVVCYSVPVQRQVVKLRIRKDSSVDLNDSAVQADLLKKFQQSLEERGVSGFTMKWRERPDGKVFLEEEDRALKQESNCA